MHYKVVPTPKLSKQCICLRFVRMPTSWPKTQYYITFPVVYQLKTTKTYCSKTPEGLNLKSIPSSHTEILCVQMLQNVLECVLGSRS